jgi:hypothetical protein
MKPVVVTLSIPSEAFLSQISSAEKISALPAADVPELSPLHLYAGRWEAEISGKSQLKRIEVGEWILNGSFLRQSWSTEGAEDTPKACGMTLMTYDSVRNAYLSWSFLAIRSVVHREGFWDAASRTMTWTDQLAAHGGSVISTSWFTDDATHAWSIKETDDHGRVVREIDGRSIRLAA